MSKMQGAKKTHKEQAIKHLKALMHLCGQDSGLAKDAIELVNSL
jgi:hypothetical protein